GAGEQALALIIGAEVDRERVVAAPPQVGLDQVPDPGLDARAGDQYHGNTHYQDGNTERAVPRAPRRRLPPRYQDGGWPPPTRMAVPLTGGADLAPVEQAGEQVVRPGVQRQQPGDRVGHVPRLVDQVRLVGGSAFLAAGAREVH